MHRLCMARYKRKEKWPRFPLPTLRWSGRRGQRFSVFLHGFYRKQFWGCLDVLTKMNMYHSPMNHLTHWQGFNYGFNIADTQPVTIFQTIAYSPVSGELCSETLTAMLTAKIDNTTYYADDVTFTLTGAGTITTSCQFPSITPTSLSVGQTVWFVGQRLESLLIAELGDKRAIHQHF